MLLKFLHALAIVYQMNGVKYYYLIKKRSFDQKYKFSNKNDLVFAWRNFQKKSVLFKHISYEMILQFFLKGMASKVIHQGKYEQR